MPYLVLLISGVALVQPSGLPEISAFYAVASDPIAEVAAVLAWTLAGATVAIRFLWPE